MSHFLKYIQLSFLVSLRYEFIILFGTINENYVLMSHKLSLVHCCLWCALSAKFILYHDLTRFVCVQSDEYLCVSRLRVSDSHLSRCQSDERLLDSPFIILSIHPFTAYAWGFGCWLLEQNSKPKVVIIHPMLINSAETRMKDI